MVVAYDNGRNHGRRRRTVNVARRRRFRQSRGADGGTAGKGGRRLSVLRGRLWRGIKNIPKSGNKRSSFGSSPAGFGKLAASGSAEYPQRYFRPARPGAFG